MAGFTQTGSVEYLNVTTGQGSWTIAAGTVGNLRIIDFEVSSTSVAVSSLSGGGVTTWSQAGSNFVSDSRTIQIFYGLVTSSGTALTINYSGTIGSTLVRAHHLDFIPPWSGTSVGVAGTGTQHNASSATVTFPSITSGAQADGQELYYGAGFVANNFVGGSTSGFTYNNDANSNPQCWDGSCAANTAFQPTGTQNSAGTSDAAAAIFFPYKPPPLMLNQAVTRSAFY